MNIKQVEWSESHDWHRYAFESELTSGEWSVCAETVCVDREGHQFVERVVFTNYKELRDWAGY